MILYHFFKIHIFYINELSNTGQITCHSRKIKTARIVCFRAVSPMLNGYIFLLYFIIIYISQLISQLTQSFHKFITVIR